MGRWLLYGSFAVVAALGGWFYAQGDPVPDAIHPLFVLLFALMSFGYGKKAQEDREYGKIRRDKNPGMFKAAIIFNHLVTGAILLVAIYLLVT